MPLFGAGPFPLPTDGSVRHLPHGIFGTRAGIIPASSCSLTKTWGSVRRYGLFPVQEISQQTGGLELQ